MPPMPVDVDTARRQSVVDAVRATGRIEAIQAIELRPDEQGRITELLFREGQSVAAGTPLVKVDDAMLKAQTRTGEGGSRLVDAATRARPAVARAERGVAGRPRTRGGGGAERRTPDWRCCELQLERTTVRAPFAGAIGQRFVSVGDYVDDRHAAAHVADRRSAARGDRSARALCGEAACRAGGRVHGGVAGRVACSARAWTSSIPSCRARIARSW